MRITLTGLSFARRRLRRRWASLLARKNGVAAVEFALILPIMVTMYIGMVELSMAFGVDRRNGQIARAVGDMLTQSASVTTTELNAIMAMGAKIIDPYTPDVGVRVSSVRIDSVGRTFLDWGSTWHITNSTTVPAGPSGRCADAATIVPVPLRVPNSTVIVTQSRVKHTPAVGKFITTPIYVNDTAFFRPRVSNSVVLQGTATTPCPGETV